MVLFDSLRDFIKHSEDGELYKYLGIFAGLFCALFGLLIYFHYSRVTWYTDQLKQLDKWRSQTRQLLRNSKLVKAQQQQVEEILARDKEFRIGQAYQKIIRDARLNEKLIDQSPPTTGETVSDKTEVQITSNLRNLSMKEVTNFLMLIAQVPQLYTKDITIKKTPGRPTVDIDITVATLEPSAT